uniref:Putative pbp/gobp family n=1 Tax=Corethrella appendiculata TaxID=1370023 RepID=U5EHT7_9DIPT
MKFLIFLIICLTLVSCRTIQEKIAKYFAECKESLNLPDDNQFEVYKTTHYPEEEPHPCFAYCAGAKFGLFDETNDINFDFMEKRYTPELNVKFRECSRNITDRSNKCKWTYDFLKCSKKYVPKNDVPH